MQTAIQWLENELKANLKHIILTQDDKMMESIFEQAKEMEKQQIADAYESGQQETANGYYVRLGEQFYNRNYDKTN